MKKEESEHFLSKYWLSFSYPQLLLHPFFSFFHSYTLEEIFQSSKLFAGFSEHLVGFFLKRELEEKMQKEILLYLNLRLNHKEMDIILEDCEEKKVYFVELKAQKREKESWAWERINGIKLKHLFSFVQKYLSFKEREPLLFVATLHFLSCPEKACKQCFFLSIEEAYF